MLSFSSSSSPSPATVTPFPHAAVNGQTSQCLPGQVGAGEEGLPASLPVTPSRLMPGSVAKWRARMRGCFVKHPSKLPGRRQACMQKFLPLSTTLSCLVLVFMQAKEKEGYVSFSGVHVIYIRVLPMLSVLPFRERERDGESMLLSREERSNRYRREGNKSFFMLSPVCLWSQLLFQKVRHYAIYRDIHEVLPGESCFCFRSVRC